jgi:D-glycero-D-manno-heptose 1,7-bisphosphate phosphatase
MSLYIFDKDGTLMAYVRSRFVLHRPPLKCEEQVLLPGVFEKLAHLRAADHKIAIATNQSAVAHGVITLKEAEELVLNCVAKIGGVSAWRLSPYDPRAKKERDGKPNPFARDDETRKPRPGMVLELMDELNVSPAETFMIGDRKMDKKCAEAAGVTFLDEKEFFKFNK